jgi:transposase
MYIRKTVHKYRDREYVDYLLVESVSTPKGPRQKAIVSLGSLSPRPREEWLALARKVEKALSGQDTLPIEPDPLVAEIAAKAREAMAQRETRGETVAVIPEKVEVECAREAGAAHVANQMWLRLGMDGVLEKAGLSEKARLLTQVMVTNRLLSPSSEHAMPDWAGRTALGDILGEDLAGLNDDALYRNMDRLHEGREEVERLLNERERDLFNLDDTIFLYDLTSTYFEGQCASNPQAKRGYSRDHRFDCKQVVVGCVFNRDGFPKAHEVFDGNRSDVTTMDDMLTALLKRVDGKGGTVVVDRGLSSADNLLAIKKRGMRYVVAARQEERNRWLAEFEAGDDWEEVLRTPSASNRSQKKSSIKVMKREKDGETFVLVVSEERVAKDRAIRESHEKRLLSDLNRLAKSVGKKRPGPEKAYESIGRLKERYPRVARYYDISFTKEDGFTWREGAEKKENARRLDGGYILRTDIEDLSAEEAWLTYSLLTRAENAFRTMKSPLSERPIFHQLKERTQAHIFLCVLAYHLLVGTEKTLRDKGDCRSWETIRETLRTHQVVTVVLPTATGEVLRIRRATTPEAAHKEVYDLLSISPEIMKPVRQWTSPEPR